MSSPYKFDLHIHSSYSIDSIFSPELIVRKSLKNNYGFISITDHDTLKVYTKLKDIKHDGLIIIKGEEIKTDYGDIIGLFLNEEIKKRNLIDVIDAIKKQDGLIIYPHPFRNKRLLARDIFKLLDFIEIFNGRSSPSQNKSVFDLIKIVNKPGLVGSDSHFLFEFNKIWNYSDKKIDDIEDVRKLLLKKEYRYFYPNFSFTGHIGNYCSYVLKSVKLYRAKM